MSDIVLSNKKLKSIISKVVIFAVASVIWQIWFALHYYPVIENYANSVFLFYRILGSLITLAIGIIIGTIAIKGEKSSKQLYLALVCSVLLIVLLIALIDIQTIIILTLL